MTDLMDALERFQELVNDYIDSFSPEQAKRIRDNIKRSDEDEENPLLTPMDDLII